MSAPELDLRPTFARGVRLQRDRLSGAPVLLFPEGLLELNATAAEIAQRCDGTRTVAQIIATLAEEYDAPAEALAADVLGYVHDLAARGLIVLQP